MVKKYSIALIIFLIFAVFCLAGYFIWQKWGIKKIQPAQETKLPNAIQSESNSMLALVYPIAEFDTRISKKPFGIYITPDSSPISPERFTGYHTGTDIEYQDVTDEVPVYAINDGTVTYSGTVNGYGGVIIIRTGIDNAFHSVLYGHLRPTSLLAKNSPVAKGDKIAVLGTGYSAETDDERRHLHFGILSNDRVDFLGYVEQKSKLFGWIDPQSLSYK